MSIHVSQILELNLYLQIQSEKIIVLFFALGLPLLLLLATVIYLARVSRYRKEGTALLAVLEEELSPLKGQDLENAAKIGTILDTHDPQKLGSAWHKLQKASVQNYQSRWLPALESQINPDLLAEAAEQNALSYQPAILIASSGVLSAVLLYTFLTSSNSPYQPGLSLIPLAVSCMLGLILANAAKDHRLYRQTRYQKLNGLLDTLVPVYNSENSVALLVDEMLSHENKLAKSVNEFRHSASKMASSDFSDGICRSVRTIMSEEVAPPLALASNSLADLARNLDRRQMTGMEHLSKEFSRQLTQDLLSYLKPLHSELANLNRLMGRTKDFVAAAMDTLETSREQNKLLNRDISESLKLMTMAKNDLANEMTAIANDVRVLSATTDKMTRSFSGEEDALADRIHELAQVAKDSLSIFSKALQNVSSSLKLAGDLKLDQAEQHQEISLQLSKLITQLEELDSSLRTSTTNFSKESVSYVNRTLKSFDEGLADVVERLIFTASALQDAVDSLPDALKQINNHNFR